MFELENDILDALNKYTGIDKKKLIIQRLSIHMSTDEPTSIEMKAVCYKKEE